MSLKLLKDSIIARSSQRFFDNQPQLNSNIDNLTLGVSKLVDTVPIPFTFIQSNNNALSSNVSDGTMIIQSPVMNHGERGVVEDLNINFTTVAGTIRIVKVRGQDGLQLVDVVRGIAASTSGTGAVVLEEGEAIAILGQSAGNGVFGAFFSGRKYKVGQ